MAAMRRRNILIITCLIVALALLGVDLLRNQVRVEHVYSRSKATRMELQIAIIEAASNSKTRYDWPTIEAFTAALHGCGNSGRSASPDGPLLDTWGHRVVFMTQNGKGVALGSAGPDGVWEGGAGDDIVVFFRDVMNHTTAEAE